MGGKISKKVVGVDEQKQIMAQEAEVTDHHKTDWVSTRKEKKNGDFTDISVFMVE